MRTPRRRSPHQGRFWLDGVEMPSSGRPGVGRVGPDALVWAAGRQPGWLLRAAHPNQQIYKAVIHFLPGQTIRKDDSQALLPGENAKSGASLRWAAGRLPLRISSGHLLRLGHGRACPALLVHAVEVMNRSYSFAQRMSF